MPDDKSWNDPEEDAPELTEEGFKRADLFDGKKLVRPGEVIL